MAKQTKNKPVKNLNPPSAEQQKTVKQGPGNTLPPPPQPTEYKISSEGLNELVSCINELVPGKYTKQVFFNIINSNVTTI